MFPVDAFCEQGATVFLEGFVDVGFVPALEFVEPVQNGVAGEKEPGFKRGALMRFEASADEGREAGVIAKTGGGTVNGQEAVAGFNKGLEGVELLGLDSGMVGVEEEGVVVAKGFRVEALVGVGEVVEPDGLAAKVLHEEGEDLAGVVMGAVVSEEKDAEGAVGGF
jgi:hypothetical protein